MSNVRPQDPSQRQRHRVLHRRQPDGRGRVGVHLDEVPLVQRRLGEEDPAGGSDLLRQHLPPQQVHTRHPLKIKAAVWIKAAGEPDGVHGGSVRAIEPGPLDSLGCSLVASSKLLQKQRNNKFIFQNCNRNPKAAHRAAPLQTHFSS